MGEVVVAAITSPEKPFTVTSSAPVDSNLEKRRGSLGSMDDRVCSAFVVGISSIVKSKTLLNRIVMNITLDSLVTLLILFAVLLKKNVFF